MLNYLKSEYYRVFHSTATYVTLLLFAGLPFLLNVVLYLFQKFTPDFPYGTTSFSFSNLVANPMIFCFSALLLVYVLYERSEKKGVVKNAIAFGISRQKVFLGQFLVSLTVSMLCTVLTEIIYIFSAFWLLPVQGPVTVQDLLMENFAVFPVAVSALILSIVFLQMFEYGFVGILLWISIFYLIPKFFFYLGLELEWMMRVAMWFPQNFFSFMQVNMSQCVTVWDTTEGMVRCVLSGTVGIVLFSIIGYFGLKKKEY